MPEGGWVVGPECRLKDTQRKACRGDNFVSGADEIEYWIDDGVKFVRGEYPVS
jgi:hypothetical protein